MSVLWDFFDGGYKNQHNNLLFFHTGDQENRLLAGEVLEEQRTLSGRVDARV